MSGWAAWCWQAVACQADVTPLQALPVQMLSPDEALLLVRDLPHLLAMGRGQVPGIDELSSRRLARRALEVAHGHPKLLELADGQAAHPDRLAEDMAADDQVWRTQDSLPTGFFRIGAAGQQTDYLDVLASWSTTATMTLALREQQLFWFLCCLEEPYRDRRFLDASWSDFWQSLGHDDHALDPERALASITAQGLVAIREGDRGQESYDIHPAVAAAGRAQAGEQFQELVDAALRNDGDTGTAYVSRPAR